MNLNNYWHKKKVLVTGGAGFIGSSVVSNLMKKRGVQLDHIVIPRSRDCDLRKFGNCQGVVDGCDVVIHLAAITGGISFSRNYPARQFYDSTLIDLNVVEASMLAKVKKFVAIGNLFAYAPDAPVPLREDSLFDGLPTVAHRGVGLLKRNLAIIADLYYRQYQFPMVVVYSANAYGPGDSVDPVHSHVIPATIMKCLYERKLTVWGDGSPTRDFLYVDDIAEGLILAAEKLIPPNFINLGSGSEISVRNLVSLIANFAQFNGQIEYDASKSGGDARRCTSTDRAFESIGFRQSVGIEEGLSKTVKWYKDSINASLGKA